MSDTKLFEILGQAISMAQAKGEKAINDIGKDLSKEDTEKVKHDLDELVTVSSRAKADLQKAMKQQGKYGS